MMSLQLRPKKKITCTYLSTHNMYLKSFATNIMVLGAYDGSTSQNLKPPSIFLCWS